MMISKG